MTILENYQVSKLVATTNAARDLDHHMMNIPNDTLEWEACRDRLSRLRDQMKVLREELGIADLKSWRRFCEEWEKVGLMNM